MHCCSDWNINCKLSEIENYQQKGLPIILVFKTISLNPLPSDSHFLLRLSQCSIIVQQVPQGQVFSPLYCYRILRYCCDSTKMHRPLSSQVFASLFTFQTFPLGGFVPMKIMLDPSVSYCQEY